MGKTTTKLQQSINNFKPLTLILSAHSKDRTETIKNNCRCSKHALRQNVIPINAFLTFSYMDTSTKIKQSQRDFFYKVLVGTCQQVFVYGEKITRDMHKLIELAKKQGKTVKYFKEV